MLAPSTSTTRFGRKINVNEWSLRGPSLARVRQHAAEVRVLVIGDSVVYGGDLVDQGELGTELAARALGGTAIVVPVAAPSWGPANQLAYLKRFGTFDAQVAVVVASAHDAFDVPTGDRVERRWPYLAVAEVAGRVAASSAGVPIDREAERSALQAFGEMLKLLAASGARLVVLLHAGRDELSGSEPRGLASLREVALGLGVKTVDLAPRWRAALENGDNPFADPIHLTVQGQRILSEVLRDEVRLALRK